MDLIGAEYLTGALNPAKKRIFILVRFKEGVKNILGMLYNEVSPEHVVLSIDNKYNFSGTGQSFAPILHAYMDTRFLPGVHADPHSEGCMKEVVDYTLQGLRRNFPNILESSQLWTVISEYPNRHFIHNVRKTHLPNTVKFYDAFYHGTKEEKIASCDCFFESSALRVTTCIFSNRGESSSEVAVRLCGGRKMLDVHNPRRYKHYSNKRAYLHEEAKTLFKRELRMQTYIDIIKPSCLEGIFFLNICRGNKAHIVAHVSIEHLFP